MRNQLLTILVCVCSITFTWSQKNEKPLYFKTLKKEKNATRGVQLIDFDKFESYFSFIPASSYHTADNRIVSCNGFYMMRIEVPNILYRTFINELRSQGKTDDLKIALPDTNAWGTNNLPFIDYYFSHRAYNTYPVVQVSKKGVSLFCSWLNEKVKNLKLKTWKDKKIQFRLPTEAEWMIAASGGDTNAIFAWKGPYMRMGKAPWTGDYMANFCKINDANIFHGDDGKLTVKKNTNEKYESYFVMNDTYDITAPVNCYWPNAYGLYCMTGNVREMVQEEGFTKGGGWTDPGGECMIDYRNTYQREGAPCEGFRIIAVVN